MSFSSQVAKRSVPRTLAVLTNKEGGVRFHLTGVKEAAPELLNDGCEVDAVGSDLSPATILTNYEQPLAVLSELARPPAEAVLTHLSMVSDPDTKAQTAVWMVKVTGGKPGLIKAHLYQHTLKGASSFIYQEHQGETFLTIKVPIAKLDRQQPARIQFLFEDQDQHKQLLQPMEVAVPVVEDAAETCFQSVWQATDASTSVQTIAAAKHFYADLASSDTVKAQEYFMSRLASLHTWLKGADPIAQTKAANILIDFFRTSPLLTKSTSAEQLLLLENIGSVVTGQIIKEIQMVTCSAIEIDPERRERKKLPPTIMMGFNGGLADTDRNMYQRFAKYFIPEHIARMIGISVQELMSNPAYEEIFQTACSSWPANDNPYDHSSRYLRS